MNSTINPICSLTKCLCKKAINSSSGTHKRCES